MRASLLVPVGFLLVLMACPNPSHSTSASTEFYVAPNGNDAASGSIDDPWATFEHAVDQLSPGGTLFVRQGTYRERLIPTVSGTQGDPVVIAAYPGETVVIDGTTIDEEGGWFGLIQLVEVDYVTIRGFTVRNAGGQAIQANDCAHVIIEDNATENSVSSGIMAWGDTEVIIRGNTVGNACTGGEGYQECISVSDTDGFEVSGNMVYGGNMEGIDVKDGCRHGVVSGNTVYELTRLGIYIDAWDSLTEDIDVFDNTVHDCREGIRVNSENGGLARNIRVFGNSVYDNDECGFWVGVGGVRESLHPVSDVLLNGNISRNNGSDGIRISVPDNGSTDNITVTNNLVYFNARSGVMVADFSTDGTGSIGAVAIINNTIHGNGTGLGWGAGGIMVNSASPGQHITVGNNIVSDNEEFSITVAAEATDTVVVECNLVDGFRSAAEETRGTPCVEGDPLFLDAEGGDFRVLTTPASPAIDAGSAEGAPAHDFAGASRPQGSAVDIGAYEA